MRIIVRMMNNDCYELITRFTTPKECNNPLRMLLYNSAIVNVKAEDKIQRIVYHPADGNRMAYDVPWVIIPKNNISTVEVLN